MYDPKKAVNEIIEKVKRGQISPERAWKDVKETKKKYLLYVNRYHRKVRDPEQSWHSFIGRRFEALIYEILNSYIKRLKTRSTNFENLMILKEDELKSDEVIFRKIAVKYGDYLLLPDTDLGIVDYRFGDPWNSKILAIVSCKTSLRERIAQACYWKLKFISSPVTRNIKVYLITTDNDRDFMLNRKLKESYEGKTRNRIIAEYELDGVYILREDFKEEWEDEKIKRYEKIFDDLVKIFAKLH